MIGQPWVRARSAMAAVAAVALVAAACGGGAASSEPTTGPPPGVDAPEFVLRCELSHVSFDDPIVLPWQPGASHQHRFFGNRSVDSNPGYERVEGAPTSCVGGLDSPSYWAPTLLDASGRRVETVALTAHHRLLGSAGAVQAFPPGFQVVAGPIPPAGPEAGAIRWSCGPGWVDVGEGSAPEDPPACDEDETLRLWVTFPDCWDGLRDSSFGSGAHVRYSTGAPGGCPGSHPVPIPQLTLAIDHPPVDPDGVTLSSGDLRTAHADFWNTWDQDRLEQLVDDCLRGDQRCDQP